MESIMRLLNHGKPVFMEFYANWCPHCQRMVPIIDKLQEGLQDSVIVQRLDVDNPQNQQLLTYYKIESVPTMILFHDREQVWRQSGEVRLEQLKKIIEHYHQPSL